MEIARGLAWSPGVVSVAVVPDPQLQQSAPRASVVAGADAGIRMRRWLLLAAGVVVVACAFAAVLQPQFINSSKTSETRARMWNLGELVRMHGIQQMRRGGREAVRLAAMDVAAEDWRDAWGASLVVRIEGDAPLALRVVVTSPGADQLWGTRDDLQCVAGK